MPIDYSKLSTEDLVAIEKGDYKSISTETLKAIMADNVGIKEPLEKQEQKPQTQSDIVTTMHGGSDEGWIGTRALAGKVAPYAPIVGATAGSVVGSTGGPAGTVAGGGLGWMAGRQVEDLLTSYSKGEQLPSGTEMGMRAVEQYPESATVGLLGPAGDVAVGAAFKGLAKAADSVARRVYEGILKIPPRSVPKWLRDKAVRAGLEGEYKPTEGGFDKLSADIKETNSKISSEIAKDPNKKIEVETLLNRLDDLKSKYSSLPDGEPIIRIIDRFREKFVKRHLTKTGKDDITGEVSTDIRDFMTGEEAQNMKLAIHRWFKGKYGKEPTKYSELNFRMNEAIADGIREELVKAYPELAQLNAKDSAMIELQKQLVGAVNRTRNWDLVGLTDLVGGGIGATVDLAFGDDGGTKGAISGLLLTRVLRSPHVMSRLAFALNRAATKMGGPRLPNVKFGENELMGLADDAVERMSTGYTPKEPGSLKAGMGQRVPAEVQPGEPAWQGQTVQERQAYQAEARRQRQIDEYRKDWETKCELERQRRLEPKPSELARDNLDVIKAKMPGLSEEIVSEAKQYPELSTRLANIARIGGEGATPEKMVALLKMNIYRKKVGLKPYGINDMKAIIGDRRKVAADQIRNFLQSKGQEPYF